MKFGLLLSEKREIGPEAFSPYYLRCALAHRPYEGGPLSFTRRPLLASAARSRTPFQVPAGAGWSGACRGLAPAATACAASGLASQHPILLSSPRRRYDELKSLLKGMPRHNSNQERVSVQTALNRRLTPSDSDDVVRLHACFCALGPASSSRRACGWVVTAAALRCHVLSIDACRTSFGCVLGPNCPPRCFLTVVFRCSGPSCVDGRTIRKDSGRGHSTDWRLGHGAVRVAACKAGHFAV